jgi:hypothetical protein
MASTPIRPSGALRVDYIPVTSDILSAKQVSLSGSPASPDKVLVDAGGVDQIYSVDYTVSGNIISWNSRGLETVLSVGDIIRIQYFIL